MATYTNYSISTRGGMIGRDHGCEISFNDKLISRLNSEIVYSNGTYYISDRKSSNGTFLKLNNSLNQIKLRNKMIFEIDNFHLHIIEILETGEIKLKISNEEKEVGFEEIVNLKGKSSRFCFDDDKNTNGRGYRMSSAEENQFEVELFNVKNEYFLRISNHLTVE